MTFSDNPTRASSEDQLPDMQSDSFLHVPRLSLGQRGTGNVLVEGDNLHVLKQLEPSLRGKVKCIYMDPPYNNGESYLHYYDSMGHEEWLAAVTARLHAAYSLISDNGSIWISIDDSELHYLKVAADAVFGRENFLTTIVWERRTTRENRRAFSKNHEYVLAYAKCADKWAQTRNTLPLDDEVTSRYKNPDKDPRGPWQSVSANVQGGHGTPSQLYTLVAPSGVEHDPPNGRCWVYTKKKMQDEIRRNNVWFGVDGTSVPRLKKFLSERNEGLTPETLWRSHEVGTTATAKKHLVDLFDGKPLFDTPKPEGLIARILHIASDPGDLVIDPYLGSGTTAAVAHKMARRYIGVESGTHLESHCVARLKQVIEGERGGISSEVQWSGGGGFDYFRAPHARKARAAK